MAVLLRADGWITRLAPANGRRFTLAELQELVGGVIEVTRARGRRRVLVLNEDGKQLMLKVNAPATYLYRKAGGITEVVGDVVLATWRELGQR